MNKFKVVNINKFNGVSLNKVNVFVIGNDFALMHNAPSHYINIGNSLKTTDEVRKIFKTKEGILLYVSLHRSYKTR